MSLWRPLLATIYKLATDTENKQHRSRMSMRALAALRCLLLSFLISHAERSGVNVLSHYVQWSVWDKKLHSCVKQSLRSEGRWNNNVHLA